MKLFREFKEFAFKGSMIDLAVAVVIGTAFAAVIGSLVKNVVMPAISYVMPAAGAWRDWTLGRLEIGAFLGELLNFVVIALAVFLTIVKVRSTMSKPEETLTKECPYCASTIPLKATRCPDCTSDLQVTGKKAA